MAKLELFYPVKPLWISQGFGVLNPLYNELGFSRHNGIDFVTHEGQRAYAVFDGYVTDVGFNKTAGHYVKIRTEEPVEAFGKNELVVAWYGHGERILVEKGQLVKAGDPLMVCDSTGFSTGNHLHISTYFVDAGGKKIRTGSKDTNYDFDPSPFFNRFYAQDAQNVLGILHRIIALLKAYLKQ